MVGSKCRRPRAAEALSGKTDATVVIRTLWRVNWCVWWLLGVLGECSIVAAWWFVVLDLVIITSQASKNYNN